MRKNNNFEFGYAFKLNWQFEHKRAVGIMPKSMMMDDHELRMPTAPINYIMVLYKKQASCAFFVKKYYNTPLMEEKAPCLGLELVPENLPSVRAKLRNNMVEESKNRITRLMFLTLQISKYQILFLILK
jgi:hypothetical protein